MNKMILDKTQSKQVNGVTVYALIEECVCSDGYVMRREQVGWTDSIECIEGVRCINGGVIISPARMTGGYLGRSVLSGRTLLSGGHVEDGCTIVSSCIEGGHVENSSVYRSTISGESRVIDSKVYGAQILDRGLVVRSRVEGGISMWGHNVTVYAQVINSYVVPRNSSCLAKGQYINADVNSDGTLTGDRVGGLSDEALRKQLDAFDEWVSDIG